MMPAEDRKQAAAAQALAMSHAANAAMTAPHCGLAVWWIGIARQHAAAYCQLTEPAA